MAFLPTTRVAAATMAVSVFLLIAGSQAQVAVPVSDVKVTVVDQTGAVIADGEVVFQSNSTTITSHTGKDGSITVTLPSGRYSVTISQRGFQNEVVHDFQVAASEPNELRVVLKVDPHSEICGPCGCDRCQVLLVPTISVANLPNSVTPEPPPAPSTPAILLQVKATVVDPTGTGISDSEVTFKSDSKTIVSRTGRDGSVRIALPEGRYDITASAAGFATNKVPGIQISAETQDSLTTVLKVGSYSGPEVVPGPAVPVSTSDVPNEITPEKSDDSAARPTTRKIRSLRCLYLWKCSGS